MTDIKDLIIEKQEELKPCPFCGAMPNKILIGNNHTKKRSVVIKCLSCFTEQRTGAIHNNHAWCEKVAIEKWNKREAQIPDTTDDEIDLSSPDFSHICGRCGTRFWTKTRIDIICESCKSSITIKPDSIASDTEQVLSDFATKISQKDIDPEIREKLTPEFFKELMEASNTPASDTKYLNSCIEKATPNLSKIKDVDQELAEIRGGKDELRKELIEFQMWCETAGQMLPVNQKYCQDVVDEYLKSKQ